MSPAFHVSPVPLHSARLRASPRGRRLDARSGQLPIMKPRTRTRDRTPRNGILRPGVPCVRGKRRASEDAYQTDQSSRDVASFPRIFTLSKSPLPFSILDSVGSDSYRNFRVYYNDTDKVPSLKTNPCEVSRCFLEFLPLSNSLLSLSILDPRLDEDNRNC